MYSYLLRESLVSCPLDEALGAAGGQFVAVLSPAEWETERERFNMGIEQELNINKVHSTKAEVNYDSLTGTFRIPDRDDLEGKAYKFVFALDERGIVFIDESGLPIQLIDVIRQTKRWRTPCLERFMYDFLEAIIDRDLSLIEHWESELDELEDGLLAGAELEEMIRVNQIRSNVRVLLRHYEQLTDMTQEFEENENGFFTEENLRYLHLFISRVARFEALASSLREHAGQVVDLFRSRQEQSQNNLMTLLTIIATIFMPLTLIVGWYGMNFQYMPELAWRWAYPAVFVVSVLVVVLNVVFFKKRKWM